MDQIFGTLSSRLVEDCFGLMTTTFDKLAQTVSPFHTISIIQSKVEMVLEIKVETHKTDNQ